MVRDAHFTEDLTQEPMIAAHESLGGFEPGCNFAISFIIREKYDISRDKRTESWVDFVSGC
jgi:DNA-directed RNA polymerase specialized sigma24 family protein